MRWDNLFDDLESQLERELTAEDLDLEAEEERLRLGRLGMRDRIAALHAAGASSGAVRIWLSNGEWILLTLAAIGRDWFSGQLAERSGQCIVPLASVTGASLSAGQMRTSLASGGGELDHPSLAERLGLPFVLRDLCRRRRAIELVLANTSLFGTIDRVGRDHVDLALHEPGSPRRASAVTELRVVPLSAVVLVLL